MLEPEQKEIPNLAKTIHVEQWLELSRMARNTRFVFLFPRKGFLFTRKGFLFLYVLIKKPLRGNQNANLAFVAIGKSSSHLWFLPDFDFGSAAL